MEDRKIPYLYSPVTFASAWRYRLDILVYTQTVPQVDRKPGMSAYLATQIYH